MQNSEAVRMKTTYTDARQRALKKYYDKHRERLKMYALEYYYKSVSNDAEHVRNQRNNRQRRFTRRKMFIRLVLKLANKNGLLQMSDVQGLTIDETCDN